MTITLLLLGESTSSHISCTMGTRALPDYSQLPLALGQVRQSARALGITITCNNIYAFL